jgi:protein required for attachment to host cells
MKPTLVLVADATQARLFSVEQGPGAAGHPTLRLAELKTLINPERMMKSHELFKGNRSDAGGRSTGHNQYTFDDHRDAHERAFEQRFAALVKHELDALAADRHAERLVIAAGPRMIGHLREARSSALLSREIIEERVDLGRKSEPEILEALRGTLAS